jgi:hypothetical protein
MCSSKWSRGLISKPRAMTHAINKRLIQRGFFCGRDSRAAIERQTVPRSGRQVLPHGSHAHSPKSEAITRQVLPVRQIFPGRSCRATRTSDAKKSAIYRAF